MDGPAASVSDAPLPTIEGVADLLAIGRGGFGTVYRGRQPHLDREVAVKVLDRSDADGQALQRFEREVGAMGRLSNHPNIVAVYDGGVTAEGRPYLVMPFVPGGSLGDLLRRDGPLAPDMVAAMGAKLAGALASTHAAGVLHRDVKPDNVLISPYGEPQLTDFGIARLADATTTAWQNVALTVHYAAPEVLGGEPASPASDVYALGATLHACLTGTPPFKGEPGEALMAVVGRIATQPAPDLRAAGIAAPLAAVVEAALAKDPAERIPTADDLRRRLEAVIATPTAAAGGGPTRTEQLPVYLPPAREEAVSPAPIPAAAPIPPVAAPIPLAAAPPPSSPAPYVRARTRRRRRHWEGRAAAAVAALVALAGLALLAITLGGGGDDSSGDNTQAGAPTTTAEPTQDGTEADDTVADDTEAAPETTAPAPGQAVASADLRSTALSYLAALDNGDLDAAFAALSPGLAGSQPRSSFDSFWGGFDEIAVVGEPRVDEAARTVVVPLSLDGAREDYPLTFIQADDGTWLVDGPRPG